MLGRISVAVIVRNHVQTFYDYGDRVKRPGSKNLKRLDIAGMFVMPAVITGALWAFHVRLPQASLGTLITALAVFGALLFNLLILVYDVSGRDSGQRPPDIARAREQTLVDLHANIAFAVLLTLVTIVVLVIPAIGGNDSVIVVTSLMFFYLGSLFVLTLLMILRRMHMLLTSDISRRLGS